MNHLGYLLWTVWLAHLTPMFFGIGEGPTNEQKQAQKGLQDVANYSTTTGENATTQSTNFWSSILSGDMSKIMQVLGPQITGIKNQGQQIKQTASQFGNRSGGTNATLQTVDDQTRAQVNDLISKLTSSAASELGHEGLSLLNTGVGAGEGSFNAASVIQKENASKWGDIFNSISEVAGAAAGFPGIAGTTTGKRLTSIAGGIG